MDSAHTLLESTEEEPVLGGAEKDGESWRQEGRTPGRDRRSEGRGVQRPKVLGR